MREEEQNLRKTSMLQRILSEMYVEPELLEELDEEQKQILFCKMREEQLRRWAVAEAEFQDELKRKGPRPRSTRRIGWLTDSRGDPWTWVMGEHPDDPSIDQLLDRDFQETAEQQAEVEAERLRAAEEEELKAKLREEALDLEPVSAPPAPPQSQPPPPQPQPQPPASSPSPSAVLAAKARAPTPGPSTSNGPPASEEEEETSASASGDEYAALMQKLREAKLTVRQQAQLSDPVALQMEMNGEREILERRLRAEAERRIEEEKERRRSEIYQSLKHAAQAHQSTDPPHSSLAASSHQLILEKEKREFSEEAEKEQETDRAWWRIQENKAKVAEEEIRTMARKARETLKLHGDVLPPLLRNQSEETGEPAQPSPNGSSSSGKKRVKKPGSREAIRDWFLGEEAVRGTGKDPKTGLVAPWFHGVISREEAESLLRGRESGSFLVRVSERIWGFTLSYALSTTQVKHFLIERVERGYQFMGTQQIVHSNLWSLVSYHESVPITAHGGEVLGNSVGQLFGARPDYADLFPSASQGPLFAKLRLPRNGGTPSPFQPS